MPRAALAFLVALAAATTSPAVAQRAPSPGGAAAYVVSPADGATVASPVTVVFGLRGMGVAPAGVAFENTGHHHLLIDVAPDSIDFENPLPKDANHVHFGGGQTEASVELAPGEHTLWLLIGDENHVPHDPPVMSAPISITVE
jgi:hypothetical protein